MICRPPSRAGLAVALLLTGLLVAACHESREPVLIAVPANASLGETTTPVIRDEPGRKVAEKDRWALSDAQSVRDLEGTEFGEREIREFWTRKGWRLTKREERYLAETDAMVRAGHIAPVSRWGVCPYTPVYQALQPIKVMGVPVKRMQEFHFEMCENENELQLGSPRFKRGKGYQEDHDEGHATDPSKKDEH